MSTRSNSTASIGTTAEEHPLIRWDERGDDREFSYAKWLAVVLTIRRPGGEEAYPDMDEVRLYQSGELEEPVLFLIRERSVVTVRPVSDTDIVPSTLKECSGCGGVHEIVFANQCPHCSAEARALVGNR